MVTRCGDRWISRCFEAGGFGRLASDLMRDGTVQIISFPGIFAVCIEDPDPLNTIGIRRIALEMTITTYAHFERVFSHCSMIVYHENQWIRIDFHLAE